MNIETEKRILEIARSLEDIDRRMVKSITERGTCETELRNKFCSSRDKLKELLSEAPPLIIRDPEVVKTLRRVRKGDYFYFDKVENNFLNAIRNLPQEQLKKLFTLLENEKNHKNVEDGEKKPTLGIDEDLYIKFETEMKENIFPEDYYERKDEFGTIIVGKPLPEKINSYFSEVRHCYLFGNRYAAVGLCRVLIEIVFRDKLKKYGVGKKFNSPKVVDIDDYSVRSIIREVCSYMKAYTLKEEADELYSIASSILHGKDKSKDLNLLDFIKRTFKLIENLYDFH